MTVVLRHRCVPHRVRGDAAAAARQQGLADERARRVRARPACGVGGREAEAGSSFVHFFVVRVRLRLTAGW